MKSTEPGAAGSAEPESDAWRLGAGQDIGATSQRIALADWPQLLGLVDQALDMPEAARAAWLAGLNLPASLQTALRALLAQRGALDADDFMAALPQVAAAVGRPRNAYATGAAVGPWRLLRQLGEGGMGVVWLAERGDSQMDRQVALKLPHAGPGHELLARRLLRERRILAALEHPHIARLYDVGLAAGGTPYLVMEYVEGSNLLVHADSQRLTVAQRVLLFQQVLAAVQHAHGKLVLHRDLKPGNILVNAAGQVKLLDFGIAKVLAEGGANSAGGVDSADITRASGRPLTPSYASPEQLRGEEPGTASDVYALGVVLYELLCGQRPHDRPGASAAWLEAAVLHDAPKPPSRQAFHTDVPAARALSAAGLAKALRGDLDAIALQALAKTADHRYGSADALAADLQRWLAGRPVAARPPGTAYYLGKFVRRNRLAVSLGSLAAAAVLAAGIVATVQGHAAEQQARRAAMARDFLLELFAESAPDRLGGAELTAAQLLAHGQRKAGVTLAGERRLQAELLAGIGQTQLQIGDMRGADAALAQAAALFHAEGDQAAEAAARLTRLTAAHKDHRFDRLQPLLDDIRPLAPALQQDRLLQLRSALAAALVLQVNAPDEALAATLQALDMADMAAPQEAAAALPVRLVLAQFEAARGQVAAADAQIAIADRQVAAQTDPQVRAEATVAVALARAIVDNQASRFPRALQWLPAVIASCQAQFGPDSRRCGELKLWQAWALLRMGEADQALAVAQALNPLLAQSTARYAKFSSAYLMVQLLAATGQAGHQADRRQAPVAAVAALESLLRADAPDPLPPAHQVPGLSTMALLSLRNADVEDAARRVAEADAVILRVGRAKLVSESAGVDLSRALVLQARGLHPEALAALGARCDMPLPGAVVRTLSATNCMPSLLATDQRPRALALADGIVSELSTALGAHAPNTQRARQLLQTLRDRADLQPAWDARQFFISGVR